MLYHPFSFRPLWAGQLGWAICVSLCGSSREAETPRLMHPKYKKNKRIFSIEKCFSKMWCSKLSANAHV